MTHSLVASMTHRNLHAFVHVVEQQDRFSPEDARFLLDTCRFFRSSLERIWASAEQMLDHGTEGRQLRFLLKEFMDVVALGMKGFALARQKIALVELAPQERTEGIALLEQAARKSLQMHEQLTKLVFWLETAPSDENHGSFPENRNDPESANYVCLDDLTKRLVSGGDK